MFQSFKTGSETADRNGWDDTPAYRPGRFHAHATTPSRTTFSPTASTSFAMPSPLLRPTSPPPQVGAPPARRRGVTRRPPQLIEDRAPGEGEGARREDDEGERGWLLRPSRRRVEGWLETWWRRWAVLVGVPCLFVWVWCAIPFPVSDPYDRDDPGWKIPPLPWPELPTTNASSRTSKVSSTSTTSHGHQRPITSRLGHFAAPTDPPASMPTSAPVLFAASVSSSSRTAATAFVEQRYYGAGRLGVMVAEYVAQIVGLGEEQGGEKLGDDAAGAGWRQELGMSRRWERRDQTVLDAARQRVRDGRMAERQHGSSAELTAAPSPTPPPTSPRPPAPGDPEEELPVDANFYFFLIVYYGIYLAVALVFITKLFDLYRLNWWPSSLGGTASYALFWTLSLLVGFLLHRFDLDGLGRRSHQSQPQPPHRRPGSGDGQEDFDWERKTTWVLLAFFAMTLPALACFAKLRADRRQSYRRSLTAAQKTFLERQLAQRMPRSYKRFLWFLLTLTISLLALIIGQGFATVYLSTLPHGNVDGLVYVWTWIATINCLNAASGWVLTAKVRSRALVFVFRFYYFLVYHIFYRNLFARLRSPDQAIYIQLLSSSFVIFWYPLSMSKTFHRLQTWAFGFDKEWEEYAEGVGTMLYLRNLSENVTMVAFLGWLTILHFGSNSSIYPFFAFDSNVDPYTYRLTATASLVIWATELGSSFIARVVIWWCYKMDVTNLGLDEFREHPELVVACLWASVHVLMDILLFLVKLNFR